jgi:hypothetical protein
MPSLLCSRSDQFGFNVWWEMYFHGEISCLEDTLHQILERACSEKGMLAKRQGARMLTCSSTGPIEQAGPPASLTRFPRFQEWLVQHRNGRGRIIRRNLQSNAPRKRPVHSRDIEVRQKALDPIRLKTTLRQERLRRIAELPDRYQLRSVIRGHT